MHHLKTAALAGASLLAMTAHAAADPVSIGFFLFSGPLGAVFSFSTLVTAATLLPAVAALGANLLFGGRGRIDPGEYKQTFENAAASEIRCVGRVRVGGLKAFGNTTGLTGYRLILHCRGPIDFVEEHFLGGRLVVVEPNGQISTPPWGKRGGSWAAILSKIGTGTETAWGQLMTAFPSLWTVDHRVRGIAQSLIQFDSPGVEKAKQFGKLYQGGYPDYERVQRCELIYDPRDGQTRWSDNGILAPVHVLRSYPDVTFDDIDWADVAIEADKADALVATRTGTEKRSRCWGLWQSEQKRGDVMRQALDSTGTEISQNEEGKFRIRLIDDVRSGTLTFTERHITWYTLGNGPEAPERPNRCRLSYYSPERNYSLSDIDLTGIAWAEVPSEIDAYGDKPRDIELPFCPSASQAQRIARRLFALERAERGVIRTNMAGLAAWDHPVLEVAFPDLDETATCLTDPVRIDDEAGECEIPFAVQPALATWNPATMEAAAPDPVPDFEYESDIAKPDVPSAATVVVYPDASYELRVLYELPEGANFSQAIYRLYPGGLPTGWTSMEEVNLNGGIGTIGGPAFAWATVAAGAVGTAADMRVQAYNSDDEASYYSDILNTVLAIANAAPAIPTLILVSDGSGNAIATAPVSLNVARLVISGGGGGALFDGPIRPSEQKTFATGPGVTYTATAYASDGTAGPSATLVIPSPGT